MTVSIRKVLAVLPSGKYATDLSWSEVGRHLAKHCNTDACKAREQQHALRDELYGDGGVKHMERVVEELFDDETVIEKRKKWVKYSRYNNVIKRIVNESITSYSEPAKRSLRDESKTESYQELLRGMQFDTVMQQVSRMFGLHRVVLVGPRVRILPGGDLEPMVDIVTPSTFRVVLHPNDNTLVIGYLIRQAFTSARRESDAHREPAWILWTDHERIYLDEKMMPIESTVVEHGLGLCPWVSVQRLPNRAGFWPGEEGEDLVSAQVSIWMSNVLQNKETKSATKQTLLSGDMTSAARQQAADTEMPIELPDGVAAATVDMSMDTSMFRDNSAFIGDSVANNYGMSSAFMKHQGVQSAEAREMMRMPLRELRQEMQPMFYLFESKFVRVLAVVVDKDAPAHRFELDGWSIDFADPQTPLTPKERLAHYKEMRAAGFDNPIAFVMRQNPDLTRDAAEVFILKNIEWVTWYWEKTRDQQAMGIGASSDQPQNIPGQRTTAPPDDDLGAQAA